MTNRGTGSRRPYSRAFAENEFEREFPGASESAHEAVISVVRAHSAIMSVLETASRDLGVSAAGRQLLATLEGADGPLSPTDIAARLFVTTPSITSLLDTLEKRELVSRGPAPDDRRKILVSITPAGRKLVDTFLPQIVALQTALLEGVNETDRKKLVKTIDAILRNARELDADAVRAAAKPRGVPRHG